MKRTLRSFLLLLTALLLTAAVLPTPALIPVTAGAAAEGRASSDIPRLEDFTAQVRNGEASTVRGVHIQKVLAYPVIQQPANQPAYVSLQADKLTQFGMASSYGSLGFLAHNTMAGASFAGIKSGQIISLVYGDGRVAQYEVIQVRRFQATQPASPYSSFVDLSTGSTLTASDLFYQTYGVRDNLVLQTCITMNGLDTWGRLFIIASPYSAEAFTQK